MSLVRRHVVAHEQTRQPWVYDLKLSCGHYVQRKLYTLRFPKTVGCADCGEQPKKRPMTVEAQKPSVLEKETET